MSPRKNWEDGMEIIEGDLSEVSSALELELYDRVLYELMNRQQSVVFGDSFKVSYVNSTTMQVKLGNGFYYDNTQVDPEPQNRALRVASNTNKTIATPHGSLNRYDVVSIAPARAVSDTDTRNFKDAGTGDVSEVTMDIETDWESTLTVTQGTASGSPAVPSTPAGHIKLCEVLVTAVTGISGSGALTDKRPRFAKPSSWSDIQTVIAAYTADLDDEIILCNATSGAFSVTLPAVAVSEGKTFTMKKIDSSANAVTIDGSGSETIDGETTQTLDSQHSSMSIYCDGSAWYMV